MGRMVKKQLKNPVQAENWAVQADTAVVLPEQVATQSQDVVVQAEQVATAKATLLSTSPERLTRRYYDSFMNPL